MSFDRNRCRIPTVYCGDDESSEDEHPQRYPRNAPGNRKYIRRGTRNECMRKGFGAGSAKERKKGLPEWSLQNIEYIGEKHEKRFFGRAGIGDIDDLLDEFRAMDANEKERVLRKVLKNSAGVVDGRAYNSVLLFLDDKGVKRLPICEALRMD